MKKRLSYCLKKKERKVFARGAAFPSAQQPALLLWLKRKILPLPRKRLVKKPWRPMAQLKTGQAVLALGAPGSAGLLLLASTLGALGAVAAANMFFFRHKQNPVAADCQRKTGFTLENDALRRNIRVKKRAFQGADSRLMWGCDVARINKNTLAVLAIMPQETDQNPGLGEIEMPVDANMQIIMAEAVAEIQGLHGGAGVIHTFLHVGMHE